MSKKRTVPNRVYLSEKQLPTVWYNVHADMPNKLAPPLNPQTRKPAGPEDFTAIFPMALIEQEMTMQRYIDIPGEVMDIYKTYRATPLIRAYRLEDTLDTPAKIYYKYEGATPSGSHKFNTAIPQAYYNKAAGMRRISTETGAGQWGTALSIACKMFGLDCTVYMVKISAQQKPYRKSIMETFGAEVFASPSMNTNAGRGILASDPLSPGSLGIAITEAVEDAATHSDTNYSLGSVLNHVALHQTIIGQEAMTQMEMIGEYPDIVIGCCGGGSNFSGIAFPSSRTSWRGNGTLASWRSSRRPVPR
jgi:tryptophan synthase beta chain